mgnify:CR=1 FL=1
MADYRTWMLTGYRQNPSNNKEGLQYLDCRGLSFHHYFSDWHNTSLHDFNNVLQSEHNGFDTSNGRYYCYSEGVVFSTVTLMFTNPNNKDFHAIISKNGSQIGVSNEHSGGGSSNGHGWNGATTSALCRVAEGDYIDARMFASNGASSGTRGYLYGGSNYNNWQVFYIAGAQRDQP